MRQLTRRLLPYLIVIILLISLVIYKLNLNLTQVKGIALDLNLYTNLINASLTAALVVITAIYALITYKTLAQMRESNQSSVRPVLWVTFDKPEFKESEQPGDEHKKFSTKAHISNYGKVAAINVQTSYEIPNYGSDEDKYMMRVTSHGSGYIPPLLSPGDSFEITVGIYSKTYDVDGAYSKYLIARVIYEDNERNLYEMNQTYYLLPSPPADHYLHLETESLYFLPLKERKYVRDSNGGVSSKGVLVFNRQLNYRLPRNIQGMPNKSSSPLK